jgi:EAL domain-containing protein (putative c-di-GMP-specific phosphodiesterase class I)
MPASAQGLQEALNYQAKPLKLCFNLLRSKGVSTADAAGGKPRDGLYRENLLGTSVINGTGHADRLELPGQDADAAFESRPPRPRGNTRFRELEELIRILEERAVTPVFQPILAFGTGEILAYEGLIRGPESSLLHTPTKLFDAAANAGLLTELNMLCARKVVRQFARLGFNRQLFLNVTPQTVLEVKDHVQRITRFIRDCGLDIAQVTIELTENQYISDRSIFRQALMLFRGAGFRVALDDLGEGFSSLRLWSELQPDFVKIDMHFVQGVSEDSVKYHFLRSLQHIAEGCGSSLVAEGVETAADFCILRDLGINNAQGFFIGRADKNPSDLIPDQVLGLMGSSAPLFAVPGLR